ncbi:chymotrypsin BI-like [Aethina tumida]|uniref:chymotrypsin BI-like n=1 Tax=Aethina tumida TaxID=116153 RepID=UPI002147324B|nr:chymotrypsin BI-like [Aethina tumida]
MYLKCKNITESFKTFQQSRITGGTEAPKHSSPWQTAFVIDNQGFCGGSLTFKNYVLTAGHCTSHDPVNDVGVVRLSALAIVNSYVQVVPLANSRSGKFNNVFATVSGWGRTTDDSWYLSPVLMRVNLTTIENMICQIQVLRLKAVIRNTNICTTGCGTKGGCNGDSSGALISYDVHIGIVSFGGTECRRGTPSVFIREE